MIKEKEITAMSDKMFKNIMKTESGLNLMKGIIEEVLGEKVEKLEILNPELKVPNVYIRGNNVDLFVKCNNQRIFVEVNNIYNDVIRERNFSYLMAQYSNDYYIGDKYHQATYYCQLNINRKCNFKDLMKRYYMQSDDKVKAVTNVEMIDFNMEKILEKCYNGTTKDRLFLYLSMIIADKDEREKIIKNGGDKNMKDFSEILSNMSEDEYYKGWCTREEDNAFMDYQTGLENGKEEGMKEGIEEGVKSNRIIVAKKLLEMNMKIEDISKATGLSINEIEKLKQEK